MICSGPSRRGATQWSRQFEGGPRYLEISHAVSVLVVEDSLDRIKRFKSWLPNARLAASASQAIEEIQRDCPEIIFLDRDLIHSFGETVAEFLAKEKFSGCVYITSANPFGVEVISRILTNAGIRFEAIPFAMLGVLTVPN